MKRTVCFALALAGALSIHHAGAQNFAERVVSYHPGDGFAGGFTNARAALGRPARVNPFGEGVDPFNPPYGTNQIVSIGAGGWLTVKFDDSVENKKRNPFGCDFIIFGNSGFIITNDFDLTVFDWVGTPATDGSLFAQNTGATRVSVSRDGRRFYELAGAPLVDALCPTDAAGNPRVPVDPALTAADFAGQTLDGIRALYGRSAGGTGFDISTARDRKGRRIHLSTIKYVSVEVISGKAEIDAFSDVKAREGDDD
jgi:hypothetical protein